MAQLSRPFQAVLVVFVLFAGVWLFALQGRSSKTTTVPATAPAPTTAQVKSKATPAPAPTTAQVKSKAAPTHTHTARAHHAAAISPQETKRIGQKSARTPSRPARTKTSSAVKSAPVASAKAAAPATHSTTTPVTRTPSKAAAPAHKSAGASSAASVTAGQLAVEADLAKGNVVVLLFWNPAGADDVAVHSALHPLSSAHNQKVSVVDALASQVASFGSITRGVQVFATPTVLVINKRGQTIVLTGLQDAFSVEQAIAEARSS